MWLTHTLPLVLLFFFFFSLQIWSRGSVEWHRIKSLMRDGCGLRIVYHTGLQHFNQREHLAACLSGSVTSTPGFSGLLTFDLCSHQGLYGLLFPFLPKITGLIIHSLLLFNGGNYPALFWLYIFPFLNSSQMLMFSVFSKIVHLTCSASSLHLIFWCVL